MKKRKTSSPRPIAPDAVPPASLGKRLQRRFFRVFNDKSANRRWGFITALTLPAAVFFAQPGDTPSTLRQDGGAERAAELTNRIADLARKTHSAEFSKSSQEARVEAEMIALSLAYDMRLSEQDAQQLAQKFLRDVGDPAFNEFVGAVMTTLAKDGYYLQDAREILQGSDSYEALPDIGAKTKALLKTTQAGEPALQTFVEAFQLYVMMYILFEMATRGILRRGSRRDDKLKQEERTELVNFTADKLKAMLAPKPKDAAPEKGPKNG